MTSCKECRHYEHGADIVEGRPLEYFICGVTRRAIWKASLGMDIECKDFEPKDPYDEIIGLCDRALDLIAEARKEEAE